MPRETQSYAYAIIIWHTRAHGKNTRAPARNTHKHKDQNSSKMQPLACYRVDSKVSVGIKTEACRQPPWREKHNWQNYRGGLSMELSRCSCCTKKHVFTRVSRDSTGWQTKGAEYFGKCLWLHMYMAGKTPTKKEDIFLAIQAPVGSSFCEHILLSAVQTVLTELKGTSCLPRASVFV